MQSQLGLVSALNKSGLDSWLEAARLVLNAAEKIGRVQFETLKTVLRESAERGRALTEVRDVAELPWRARRSAVTAAERTLDYTRNVYDTAHATGVQLFALAQHGSTAVRQGWFEALENLTDTVPGGKTGGTKAVIDSTRATVEAVAEGFTRTAKQTFEVADAMMKTTSDSAASAIRSIVRAQAG
jgi:phasin family protein